MSGSCLVEKLIDWVDNGSSRAFASISHAEINELLDVRDSDEFESQWLGIYHRLEEVSSSLSDSDSDRVQRLCKAVYTKSFEISQHPEFSSYVSDDFELLGKSLIADSHFPWLNGLWISYKNGCFPAGEIEELPGKLGDLI